MPIREIFANAPLSRQRGYTAAKFSFNSGDGRCPTCGGSGFEHVEMQFLSDVYLRCPDCDGKRYRPRSSRCASTAGWAVASPRPAAADPHRSRLQRLTAQADHQSHAGQAPLRARAS
jgi:excinuclease ABC subunit A